MEQNRSTSRYILVALCIVIVITAFILIGLNAMKLEQRLGINLSGKNNTADQYRQGYLAARDKFKNSCPMIGRTGTTISGTIESISGDTIKLKQDFFDTDETIDGVSNSRTAKITNATKIILLTQKSPDALAKEMAEFKPSADKPMSPPSPVIETTIKISNLKVGDTISITSDKELRLAESFNAVSIIANR